MIKVEKYKIGEENVNYRIDKIIPILNEKIKISKEIEKLKKFKQKRKRNDKRRIQKIY